MTSLNSMAENLSKLQNESNETCIAETQNLIINSKNEQTLKSAILPQPVNNSDNAVDAKQVRKNRLKAKQMKRSQNLKNENEKLFEQCSETTMINSKSKSPIVAPCTENKNRTACSNSSQAKLNFWKNVDVKTDLTPKRPALNFKSSSLDLEVDEYLPATKNLNLRPNLEISRIDSKKVYSLLCVKKPKNKICKKRKRDRELVSRLELDENSKKLEKLSLNSLNSGETCYFNLNTNLSKLKFYYENRLQNVILDFGSDSEGATLIQQAFLEPSPDDLKLANRSKTLFNRTEHLSTK